MAKKKPPPKVKKKPAKMSTKRMLEQPELPSMEEEKDPLIHDSALTYADVRDRRCALSKEEKQAKQALVDVMHKAGKTRYKYRELVVDLTTKGDDVKVRIEGAAPALEGDSE